MRSECAPCLVCLVCCSFRVNGGQGSRRGRGSCASISLPWLQPHMWCVTPRVGLSLAFLFCCVQPGGRPEGACGCLPGAEAGGKLRTCLQGPSFCKQGLPARLHTLVPCSGAEPLSSCSRPHASPPPSTAPPCVFACMCRLNRWLLPATEVWLVVFAHQLLLSCAGSDRPAGAAAGHRRPGDGHGGL